MAHLSRPAGSFWSELSRRAALARQARPPGVSSPSLSLMLGELPSLLRRGPPPLPYIAERPQAVMLLPGFFTHPVRMAGMRRGLEAAGHTVHDWGLGFNLGPTPENFALLLRHVAALSRAAGEPVSLVGWSLGGLFAREVAHRVPASVRKVITMGTPFSGDLRANNAWRAYQFVAGHPVDAPPVEVRLSEKPPVPTIALWSPRDGVVHPRSARGWPGERDRAVALRCTHLGFAGDGRAIAEVLRQLDRED